MNNWIDYVEIYRMDQPGYYPSFDSIQFLEKNVDERNIPVCTIPQLQTTFGKKSDRIERIV